MTMTEDEIVENNANQCLHCTRNTLLPYEYKWSRFICGYKNKKKLVKFPGKKNLVISLKNAEKQI